jgi:hypothetical protein
VPKADIAFGSRGARSQCGEAVRAFAQAAIRSVELIVQPGAKDSVGETRVRGDLTLGHADVNVRLSEGRQN